MAPALIAVKGGSLPSERISWSMRVLRHEVKEFTLKDTRKEDGTDQASRTVEIYDIVESITFKDG